MMNKVSNSTRELETDLVGREPPKPEIPGSNPGRRILLHSAW